MISSDRKWALRKYSKGDESQILDLFKVVFGKQKSKDYWQWKYMGNPSRDANIWVAEDGGRLVGHMALIPVKIKIEDSTQLGAQAVDLMVLHEYRKQGMFLAISNAIFKLASEENIGIVYGFPNEQAHRGHLKCGWFDVGEIPVMVKYLNFESIIEGKFKNRLLVKLLTLGSRLYLKLFFRTKRHKISSKLKINQVEAFDDKFDSLWSKASLDYKIIIARTKEYLNWRYSSKGDGNYVIFAAEVNNEIVGYIVLKIVKNNIKLGFIVDILTSKNNEDAIRILIANSLDYFSKERVDKIVCWMCENTPQYKVLERNGFKRKSTMPLIARINIPDVPRNIIFNPTNWFVVIGDSDHI